MKKRTLRRLIISFSVLAILTLGSYWILETNLKPTLLAYGEAELTDIAMEIMTKAANDAVADVENMGDVLISQKDANGHISMLSLDNEIVNTVSTLAQQNAQEGLEKLEITALEIPLGNLLGSELFSGQGPVFHIRAVPIGSITTSYHTEFESEGINQTRYKTYLVLEANMNMITGVASKTVTATSEIVISDAILVGEVPQVYANIPSNDGFLNLIP